MVASQSALTDRVRLAAQLVIVGGLEALTVTVKSQLGPPLTVQVTAVVPTLNVDPDGGAQDTVPHGPLVVGAA